MSTVEAAKATTMNIAMSGTKLLGPITAAKTKQAAEINPPIRMMDRDRLGPVDGRR
jgi:hypothetical protein